MNPLAKFESDELTGAVLTRSVIGHCLDVAHCAKAMITSGVTRARIEAAIGRRLDDVDIDRLAVVVGIHDFGKLNRHFQNKIHEAVDGVYRGPRASHLVEGYALLLSRQPGHRPVLEPILNFFGNRSYNETVLSILGHHGGPLEAQTLRSAASLLTAQWGVTSAYNPQAHLQALVDALFAAFPLARRTSAPFPPSFLFSHTLAGLIQTADKMGSDTYWFPLDGPEDRPDVAPSMLDALGWTPVRAPARPIVPRMRPLQRLVSTIPLEQLTIVEGPTGTGKTEAALIHFQRLFEAGEVDGIYFAVPTRSAASELFVRISRLLRTRYRSLRGKCIRALPGFIGRDKVDPDAPPSWAFGASYKRLGAPVAVGTIDQCMLSSLRVRHAWVRAWCLSRQLIVIDEAHATDAHMREIVTALIERQKALGGYVLLMSATLGEAAAARFLGRSPLSLADAIAKPYPAVSTTSDLYQPRRSPKKKNVDVDITDHADALIKAEAAVRSGKSVLWIRSTVTDAVADFEIFEGLGLDVVLHHSRYAPGDRRHLDGVVIGRIGKSSLKGPTPRTPCIIVATQTCEQSLDIDADLLISDCCPSDVLLQRLGRLGRHREMAQRWPLILIVPSAAIPWRLFLNTDGEAIGQQGFGWAWIYSPLYCRLAVEWLTASPAITVPTDCRRFVEETTHPDAIAAAAARFGGVWDTHVRLLRNTDYDRAIGAQSYIIDHNQSYGHATVDPAAVTRLGDMTVDIATPGLRSPITQRNGADIPVMPIPIRWLGAADPTLPCVVSVAPSGRQILTVTTQGGARRFVYDRKGLRKLI
jgi:CRISPR-associated endonuclease/helicase Cas3